MSHLSDEDDEFLYGISDTDKVTNPLSDTKNDVDDLYELYDENETKDTEQKEEDVVADQEVEKGSEDLEIILEPEEEEPKEVEVETKEGETVPTAEEKDTPVNIKPGQQGKPSSTPADNTSSKANLTNAKSSQGGINLELIGEYNGQPITDVDLDNVEDKPWRKPGADITDYFNYGFNEISWRSYCAKQKMLRENKKMMGDLDMGDFMSMGMMMPPNMMDGSMPMAMAGMPNPMMALPMGMPPPQTGGNPAMRNRPGNFNARGSGRNMPMSRSKNADGKEGGNEMMNPMDGNMQMEDGSMFPMEFPGGPGGMPMNMFPPDMPGGPMGMPFFNPNMPGGMPMGFDGGDFRGGGGGNNSSRSSMRGSGHMSSRSQMPRSSHDDSSEHRSDSRKRQMNDGGSSSSHRESSSNQDDHYSKRSRNR
ncbi:hypothetical protein INT48_008077 [Thamnidium elegans]|uniref:Pre-mRNA polyadenylation factor Fip1 domain-containing protein n=1 Tax=Thamnidium elegans TaxID=101142 RepID=A0A8H7SH75_9FUNG|nr:hypothetical protein INT48_008077 [Thamnidium elegans]